MSSESTTPPLDRTLNIKLSTMMFLQYAIWGAWLPFLYSFLSTHRGFTGAQIGDMFAAGAIGAIIGPFIAGQVADRYFSTEKFLALSHFLGAVLIWQLSWIDSYGQFLAFSLVYGIVYAPTISLTNSLSFHHLPDRDRDFGRVRMWGTFGWIAVGLAMGHWLAGQHMPADPNATTEVVTKALAAGKADAFKLSALLGAAMGLFCLFLPHTPPSPKKDKNAFLGALSRVKYQPLLTLFLLSVPISCIHQFYFVHTEAFLTAKQISAPEFFKTLFGAGGGGLMTVGQMSEVLILGAITLIAKKTARKWLLTAGVIAYGLRMVLFAYVDQIPLPTMATLLTGIALHGFCFGCFIFVAYMVVDEETPDDVRASAQNLVTLVIIGIGIIVGSKIAGEVSDWATVNGTLDYTKLFSIPMWASFACLGLLLLFYPSRSPAALEDAQGESGADDD
ncbi:MAG: MFS transporter [Verrucomicrobiota bacterium]|nr:MFS transporter [Verrucomicrobiota bacterium]